MPNVQIESEKTRLKKEGYVLVGQFIDLAEGVDGVHFIFKKPETEEEKLYVSYMHSEYVKTVLEKLSLEGD